MTMFEAVGSVFKKYAKFSGRARRSEYWYFVLFSVLVSMVINIAETAVTAFFGAGAAPHWIWNGLRGLYTLGTLLPSMAVGWRRLHDGGHSGWNYLIPYIIILGMVVAIGLVGAGVWTGVPTGLFTVVGGLAMLGYTVMMLVWLTSEGSRGDNKYGPDPKAEPAAPGEKAPWEY